MNEQGVEMVQDPTKKYPCPQCNAELMFDPAKGLLVCSFCGYQASASEGASMTDTHTQTTVDEAQVEVVEEHDLLQGLRLAKTEQGWGTTTRSFQCNSCRATVTTEPQVTATICPFCGSHQVLPTEASTRVIRPESLIPFQVDQKTSIAAFRKWLGSGWFRPNALKQIAQQAEARLQGIYLPFWTFDAQTFSRWTAEAGYYYYVTEHYNVTVNGRTERRTRQVRKIRWQPAAGKHDEFLDDVLVFATKSIDQQILTRIYPFDTKALIPYRPQYLAGWRAEEYQIGLEEGWGLGQQIIQDRLRDACAREVPGDTHRNLHVQTRFENLTFKHALLPVWIASYRFSNRVYNFMVNGQTGKVQGQAPISWWKVALAILLGLLILALIVVVLSLLDDGESVSMYLLQPAATWIGFAVRSVAGPILPI